MGIPRHNIDVLCTAKRIKFIKSLGFQLFENNTCSYALSFCLVAREKMLQSYKMYQKHYTGLPQRLHPEIVPFSGGGMSLAVLVITALENFTP